MKGLDGHTHYKMLYDVKLDLAKLHAFGTLCAIIGPSKKFRNVHGLWVGQQASAGHM